MSLGHATAARVVGRYALGSEVGRSYLGPLFAAHSEAGEGVTEPALLRLVSLADLDSDTRVRMLEAAWQAMEVRHERVLAVLDVVASDGELGVVFEYRPGQSLRVLLGLATARRKPMPAAVVFRVMRDLLEGAAALHDNATELGEEALSLYGGLSADSTMIGADGRATLLDAVVSCVASAVVTLGGQPERVAYASPEQISGAAAADARSDVFTLGVLAWELCANRRLFLGSDKAIAQKVVAATIPNLADVNRPNAEPLPSAVGLAVMKALGRDPNARFQSIAEMRAAFDAALPDVAEPEAVAEYVRSLADTTRGRAAPAKEPATGPRVALGSRIQEKRTPTARPSAALRMPKPMLSPAAVRVPRGDAAGANVIPKPAGSAKAATGRAKTIIGVAPAPKTASTTATPSASASVPAPEHEARTPEPATAKQAPGIAAKAGVVGQPGTPSSATATTRARQPTMMGLAPPSAAELQAAARFMARDDEPTMASAVPASGTPVVVHAPGKASADDEPTMASPLPAFSSPIGDDDEKTTTYEVRDLLSQVAAMNRAESPPVARPPAAPVPAISEPVLAPSAPTAAPPESGGWLDGPDEEPGSASHGVIEELWASHRPTDPAPEIEPATTPAVAALRLAPVIRAPVAAKPATTGGARWTEAAPSVPPKPVPSRRPGAAPAPYRSVAPPAVLPSQIPPPLIHDPRASRVLTMPPSPVRIPSSRALRQFIFGALASVGLVAISAIVGFAVFSRHSSENADALRERASAVAAPPTVVAAPQNTVAGAPSTVANAPTHAPAPPNAEPAAATDDTPAPSAPPVRTAAPVRATSTSAHAAPARAHAVPAKATHASNAKKKRRYVPNDI
jgi:serine/threonine-protein kinase